MIFMALFRLFWISVVLFVVVLCNETCDENESSCNINTDAMEDTELNRISTTGIGEVQHITLQSKQYELKTLSIKPLAFEIPNYLTNEECDEITCMSFD